MRRPLIIDCGANIGLTAIWFSLLFPDAQIFAVEPAADNIEIAKQNLRAYPLQTFTISKIMDAADAQEVLIAKIDIEGAEANLFRSH